MTNHVIDSIFGLSESEPARRRFSLRALLALWWNRAASRKALAELDDRMLADIGLTRTQARLECNRHFWQGEHDMHLHRLHHRG